MSENNTASTPSPKNRFAWLHYITMAAALLALIFQWRQLNYAQQQKSKLLEQNKALQSKLMAVQAELDNFRSGDSSTATRERLAAARAVSTATPLEIAPETLVLQSPTVTQTDAGLSVQMSFESTASEPPDSIALMVRVPTDADSRITALEPADESLYSDINTHIDERGKFAVIQGSPANLKALQFNLTVSRPTKVVIQGTSGIKGFELQISQKEALARKL